MLHIKLNGMEKHHARIYSDLKHTPNLGGGVKMFLLKAVILPIKLNGMEYSAPRRHIFLSLQTPSTRRVNSIG